MSAIDELIAVAEASFDVRKGSTLEGLVRAARAQRGLEHAAMEQARAEVERLRAALQWVVAYRDSLRPVGPYYGHADAERLAEHAREALAK